MITQDDLKTMVQAAKACNVDFIWAAHPGLQQGISFSNESAMAPGIDALMKNSITFIASVYGDLVFSSTT